MTARKDGPSAEVRIRVMKRDRFQCTYCGVPGTEAELEIDHIIAVSKGGSHHMSNLTTACRACNQLKSDGKLEPIRKARAPAKDGLIGMFLHTYKDGSIQFQGQVIGLDGDTILVQLFGWFHGAPTEVIPMFRGDLYSHACRLYADAEVWRAKAVAECERDVLKTRMELEAKNRPTKP